jgi:hypothetical protein
MLEQLYVEHKLCEKFAMRFSLSEFKLMPSQRKDIYGFIHNFVLTVQQRLEDEQEA